MAIEVDRFFDHLAKFAEDHLLVIAMATAKDQAGRAANVTLVFIGPLNNFSEFSTILDFFAPDGKLHGTHLVAFGIVSRFPGNR